MLPSYGKQLQAYTPIEALIDYFPSPSLMRCLNHSDIPNKTRKALITRQINFPNKSPQIENITIGTKGSGFTFQYNSMKKNGDLVKKDIKNNPYFGLNVGGMIKQSLLGLENLLELQKKIYIKDKIEGHKLDFETFLKTTKGMIGDKNYLLELTGEDRIVDNEIKYFLNGYGMFGQENIIVKGAGLKKDSYELYEKIGQAEVYTKIKVYD